MQSIMWIILAATMALAVLVDRTRNRAVVGELGDAVRMNGLSIRLPSGWVGPGELQESDSVVEVKEPYDDSWARLIRVSFRRPSLADALGALSAATLEGVSHESRAIAIGGGEGNLVIRKILLGRSQRGSLYETQLLATRQVPDGRVLSIAMNSFARNKKDVENDVQLIARVAESVKFDEAQ